MKKLDCSIICDLIPLCRDGVASQASEELVKEHILTCESCRKEYYEDMSASDLTSDGEELKLAEKDDKKIIKAIRMQTAKILTVLLIIGAVIGVAITSGFGVFFNFTIMPLIGLISYFILRPRFYIAPLSVASMALVYGAFAGDFMTYAPYALIYMWLIMIGYFVGFLFRFAFFGKEEEPKKARFCGTKMLIAVGILCVIPILMYVYAVIAVNLFV